MTFSRPESMRATTKRHPSRITARLGCDAQGRLTALAFEGVFDTGAYASWGPTVANRVPVHATGPYRVPAVHATARAVHTHGPVAGAFRGFGVPQAAIATETLIDRLADAAGIDPLAFRLANALRDGDRTATGQQLASIGLADCLEALAPRWREARAAAAAHNAGRPTIRRGVGLAAAWYGCGNTALPNPSTIRIGLAADGAVVLHQGAIDIGQGSATVIAQIAADALGLPLAAFRFVDADTARTPDAGKTSASRQTVVSGRAAEAAAGALRAAILRHANAGPDARLALAPGRLEVSGARSIDLAALPRDALGLRLRRRGDLGPADHRPRRRRPGHPLRRLRHRRPDRRARGRHGARHRPPHPRHRRPRPRPRHQPDARRGPDRGRHRHGARHGADGGIPARPAQPARLPDPDDRRRPRDRADPDREARPRGPRPAPAASASTR